MVGGPKYIKRWKTPESLFFYVKKEVSGIIGGDRRWEDGERM